MLNMKKGLALVLAAATAFTFAPVAGLTAPAVANAAVSDGFEWKSVTLRAGESYIFGATASNAYVLLKINGSVYQISVNKVFTMNAAGVPGAAKLDKDVTLTGSAISGTANKSITPGTFTIPETSPVSELSSSDLKNLTVSGAEIADTLTKKDDNTASVVKKAAQALTGLETANAAGQEVPAEVYAAFDVTVYHVKADGTVEELKDGSIPYTPSGTGYSASALPNGTSLTIPENLFATTTKKNSSTNKLEKVPVGTNGSYNSGTGEYANAIDGVESVIRRKDGFYLNNVKIYVNDTTTSRDYQLTKDGDLQFFHAGYQSGNTSVSYTGTNDAKADETTKISDLIKNKTIVPYTTTKDNGARIDNFNTENINGVDHDYLVVDIFVKSAGSHTFTIGDFSEWARRNGDADITFTVNAGQSHAEIPNLDIVEAYYKDYATTNNTINSGVRYYTDSNGVNHYYYTDIALGDSTWNTNEKVYGLTLNNSYKGYAIEGLSGYTNGEYTRKTMASWTGVLVDDAEITVPSMPARDGASVDANGYLKLNGNADQINTYEYSGHGAYWVPSDAPSEKITTIAALEAYQKAHSTVTVTFTYVPAEDGTYTKSGSTNNYVWFVNTTAPTSSRQKVTVSAKSKSLDDVVATTDLPFTVDKNDNILDLLSVNDAFGWNTTSDAQATNPYAHAGEVSTDHPTLTRSDDDYQTAILDGLNLKVQNKGKFVVRSEGNQVEFRSSDPSIIDVNATTGEYTVKGEGRATVYIFTDKTQNYNAFAARVIVYVNDYATDHISLEQSAATNPTSSEVDMDVPANASKPGAVTQDTLTITSAAGLQDDVKVTSSNDKAVTVAKKDSTHWTLTSVGEGTATITVTTPNTTKTDKVARVAGQTRRFNVRVWSKAPADFTFSPVTLRVGENVNLNDSLKVTTPANFRVHFDKVVNKNFRTGSTIYSLSDADQKQTTSRLYGQNSGEGSVAATVLGTDTTRPTTITAKVTVLNSAADSVNTITLGADSQNVLLNVGDTKTISASNSKDGSKTVTFKSDDESIATVAPQAASGSAVVTAVKAGDTTITVTGNDGATAKINVKVVAKDTAKTVAVPSKVKTIKVRNVKGAKAKISYTKLAKVDGYKVVYKYKKNGKLVRKTFVNKAGVGSKTVSVPKNTSVKVWVRAFRLNDKNQRVNGAYKTKTFKTDKK